MICAGEADLLIKIHSDFIVVEYPQENGSHPRSPQALEDHGQHGAGNTRTSAFW
jgi:hypothetical protein